MNNTCENCKSITSGDCGRHGNFGASSSFLDEPIAHIEEENGKKQCLGCGHHFWILHKCPSSFGANNGVDI
jgi:hypothetical protein